MISIALATALALSQGNPTIQPRKNYADCLSKYYKSKQSETMEPAAFTAAMKAACASPEAAFTRALVDYDIKMGSKRAAAEENAAFDIEGYLTNISENYADQQAAKKPRAAEAPVATAEASAPDTR